MADERVSRNEYFAKLETEDIGGAIIEKVEDYYNYIWTTGTITLWREGYRLFFNGYRMKGQVEKEGKQLNKRRLNTNHLRNIMEHIKVLTVNNRPAFEPRATNSDYKSMSQTILAREILDYYMKQKDFEEVEDLALDFALQTGEGWVYSEWDDSLGKILGMEDEEIETDEDGEKKKVTKDIREGDIRSMAFHPIDVIRDFTKDSTQENEWYIIRRMYNKYELAAKYPAFADEIKRTERDREIRYKTVIYEYDEDIHTEMSDYIPLYILRHNRTVAIPEGRQVECLETGTVLFDGDLPYDDLCIYNIMAGKRHGTNFGYTVMNDLIPMQKALDMCTSSIVSNINAFGVQNIMAQKGHAPSVSELTEGLKLIEYIGENPPQPLNLLQTPAEVFNFRQELIHEMETISGVNSVSRGNPEPSLRSGSALALIQSMAIQFSNGLQKSFAIFRERFGTGIINIAKKYAETPRVISIVGESNKGYVKEFKSEDLSDIDRVTVDVGNPLSKTLSGRMAIADSLLERQLIREPGQYIQLVRTGSLNPILEPDTKEQLLIKQENEKMSDSERVRALAVDNHVAHIKGHAVVLSSPEARSLENEEVIAVVTEHMSEHLNMLRTVDPQMLMVLGQQPLGAAPGAPGAPPVPGQEQPTGAPAPGAEGAAQPKLPSMPKNPVSGETFNNETGGL